MRNENITELSCTPTTFIFRCVWKPNELPTAKAEAGVSKRHR